jgi:peptidoglycan hydrolase CwlO-like protein
MAESPDTFSAAIALIGLAVDPKACAKRLDDLQKQLDKTAAAAAKLEVATAAHDQKVAAAKADLDARGAAVLKREAALGIAEGRLAAREKAIAAVTPPRFTADPTGAPGTISHSGLAREAYHG